MLFPAYSYFHAFKLTIRLNYCLSCRTNKTLKVVNVEDVIVIGSGMAGLTAAALLSQKGLRVKVLEQNWIAGGCSSSYPRHHFIFEAGATTLVGLDENMPLRHLIDVTGIQIDARRLNIPMKVRLDDSTVVTRYQDLETWIAEAERVFGPGGQRGFWQEAYKVSQSVWETSLRQLAFPPTRIRDLMEAVKNISWSQVRSIPNAFRSVESLLKKYKIHNNKRFRAFVDEQLLITAQNYASNVNVLFGATALCYTNYGNYYVPGGMYQLIKPIIDYIESKGGSVDLRTKVEQVKKTGSGYIIQTKKKGEFQTPFLISAIPLNNTLDLFGHSLMAKYRKKVMSSEMLRSAFQMGIAFRKHREFEAIHHQIHLGNKLPEIGARSIFVSLSHKEDTERCKPGEAVASISTHIFDPNETLIEHKELIEERIIEVLEENGFLKRENILYKHSSTPGAWKKWTAREWGFVGGYPQYLKIKPWQMKDARLDGKGAYICGDSTYPGQGIPGACLSGIIAVEKLQLDHGI